MMIKNPVITVLICAMSFITVFRAEYGNFYGIGWRGSAADNLKFAKQMGYDYVAYQTGMESLPDAAGMKFYIIDPEYYVFPVDAIMSYSETYTTAEQQLYEQYMAWKSTDAFPDNIATGYFWAGDPDRFRVEPDWQQQDVIDYFTQRIVDFAKSKENPAVGFTFGGYMWDVPDVRSRFWLYISDTKRTPVDLGYWTGTTDACLEHSGITHEYATYSDGWYAHYKELLAATRAEFPDARFIIEPYDIYGDWIQLIQDRSDKEELAFDLIVQEGSGTEFVDDSRIFASGQVTKECVGSTSPGVSSHADNLRVAAKAAINGAWFSWFGRFGGTNDMPNYQNVYEVPARLQLIRAMANWENVADVPLASRLWDGQVYQSPNSYGDGDILYARHPDTGNIFVVWLDTDGYVQLKSNESIVGVQKADSFFIASGDGSADLNVAGNQVYLVDPGNTGRGYILQLSIGPDTTPPAIVNVTAGSSTSVRVNFDEKVDSVTAVDTDNYTIDNGIAVSAADLAGNAAVTLTTSSLSKDVVYTLTVSGISDRADTPNTMAAVHETFTWDDCRGSNAAWQNFSMAGQAGTFEATYNATPQAATCNALVTFSSGNAADYSDCALLVRFNTAGKMDVRNGGTYQADRDVAYEAGTEYHFRITANIVAHTYSVYVTPDGGVETTLADGYAFRSDQSGVTTLDTWNIIDDTGLFLVCDMAVDAGTGMSHPQPGTGLRNGRGAYDTDRMISLDGRTVTGLPPCPGIYFIANTTGGIREYRKTLVVE